jgi:molecular chaperone DnaK
MGKAIGIDLGTTNSVMSIRVLKSDIIPNKENETLTPSVVAYKNSSNILGMNKKTEIVVGQSAHDFLLQDPENSINSVKRLMGRSYSDPAIQNLIYHSGVHYKIVPHSQGTSSSLAIKLKDGTEVTPPQVSGEILKKLKADAEVFLKDEVTEAVITVPAYFNEKQKHATYQAAELAGFKISRLLSEPSAAAIAYGIDDSQDAKTILIYDFGGGTLDISILSYANGHFMEQAKGGDMWLGGDDIDVLLTQFINDKLCKEFSINNFNEFLKSLTHADALRIKSEIKRAAEKAKITLSSTESTLIEINNKTKTPNGLRLQFEFELTRKEFEDLIQPIVYKSESLINEVLTSVHFTKDLIDHVLMVGGSSTIPVLQNSLRSFFGSEKIKIHDRPMHAIAEGAAILAKKLTGSDALTQKLGEIMYRSAHDYYLKLANGEQMLLVEKQSVLPITVKKDLKYEHPTQLIGNFCFSSRSYDFFEPIGELWMSHLPTEIGVDPNDPAPEIELQFTVTEDELVQVQASLKDSPDVSINKIISRGGENEKLFNELKQKINSYNEKLKIYSDNEDSSDRGFNLNYFSSAIAKQISEQFTSQLMNTTDNANLVEKINQIHSKFDLAVQLSEFDRAADDSISCWSQLSHYEALPSFCGDCFASKENLSEFKSLTKTARQTLIDLESDKLIKDIFSKMETFIKEFAPTAERNFRLRSIIPTDRDYDSTFFSSIRTGINN